MSSNTTVSTSPAQTVPFPPLEAFGIPAAVYDEAGILLACNSAFETLTGYAGLEGVVLDIFRLQQDDGSEESLMAAAITMDFPASGNASMTRADTVVLEVAWTLGKWETEEGCPPRMVLTATDVTDEKCLACKIKHSRDKYKEAFDGQTELVCRFDPDTTIRFVNDAYAQAFGRTPRQLIGTKLVDLMTPEDARDFTAYLSTFSRSRYIRDGEESFELAAGIQSHQWWRRRAIFDGDGVLVAFQSVGRDITQQKEEQADAARVARIVEASSVIGLRLRYGPGWPIEYITANVERLMGWNPEDLMGGAVSANRLLHPQDRDDVLAELRGYVQRVSEQGTLRAQPALRHVFRMKTKSGGTRWVEASTQVEVSPRNKVTHVETLLNDVTAFIDAQHKVEASEKRLLDFAEAANDWFWEMGADLRFTWISRHVSENRTFDLDHVLGKTRQEIARVEDLDAWRTHQADLEAHRPFRDFRFTLELPDGRVRRVAVSGRPLFDAAGTFLGYRGTSTDVTSEEETQAALDQTHQNYRAIFHTSEVGLWDFDLRSLQCPQAWNDPSQHKEAISQVVINRVNRAAVEQIGLDFNEIQPGDRLGAYPQLQALFRPLFAQAQIADSHVLRCDVPWKGPQGTRNFLMIFRPPQMGGSLDRAGVSVDSAVVSVLDITERVTVEERLRDSEGRFRSMFEHSVPGMALIGTNGHWLRMNAALCKMLGTTEKALFDLTLFDLFPKDRQQSARDWMGKALIGGANAWTAEQRLIRPDGKDLWAHFSLVLLRDSKGVPLYFIGQAVDITTRKNAETRAAEAEAQLRDAISAMDDGFILFDKDDRLISWNDRFTSLYNTVADLLEVGRPYHDLSSAILERGHYAVPHPSSGQLITRRNRLRLSGPSAIREQSLADGRWLEIKETRTRDGGVVAICSDITAQKSREDALRHAMEEARLADRAKSEFLANMSHELRTPLNAIIGFSEILWQEMFGPIGNKLYQEYAEGIHDSGRHLLQIIGDILDLSKIESGELSLDLEPLDLSEVIEAAVRMVRARAESRHIKIMSQIDETIPRVMADELRVKQVVLNILSNALKFSTPDQAVTISYRVGQDAPLTIVIEDQGIGMSPDEIAVACSMFGQVQSAFSRQIQGTGLGLPICIKLMQAHHGRLDIESEKGAGTRVLLHFTQLVDDPQALLDPVPGG